MIQNVYYNVYYHSVPCSKLENSLRRLTVCVVYNIFFYVENNEYERLLRVLCEKFVLFLNTLIIVRRRVHLVGEPIPRYIPTRTYVSPTMRTA